MHIGNPAAQNLIYLPHSPIIPDHWSWQQSDAVETLISANSNHWRKIMVIAAKIFSPDEDWRHFLYSDLLWKLCLCTEPSAQQPVDGIQLISGKAASDMLNVSTLKATPLLLEPKLQQLNAKTWLVPYLDYRQFPDRMIALLRQAISGVSNA
ncbi:DUF6942 family protein [Shewanella dokdonensis]|uniref:Uncharacterized protein n=1 Tax=Shewanella dokdonensis TaxID=712036 RepID=A0ABX8DEZ7_9GAMM|nr:hypothetical protein [Shewanella dokdonensis]MCL1076470.1 hypothetical protein [Shewanella dokdonensis]QVK23309.1 hypothetical protein KHX94_00230 [Shewanella dokdonensis]